MTGWTAIVPIKPGPLRKSRLGLHPDERFHLTEWMLAHVLATLDSVPQVAEVAVLARLPRRGRGWVRDQGRPLNVELTEARGRWAERSLLVVHADLPEVEPCDIIAMIGAATAGAVSVAPDRHGNGTNAVALPSGAPFCFAFGPDSCARHLASARIAKLVVRRGLANDIDTPEDLAQWRGLAASAPTAQTPVMRMPVPGTL